MNYALVLAAGRGIRMGTDCPKQFLTIGGEMIYIKCLRHFVESPLIDGIVLAVPHMMSSRVKDEVWSVFPKADLCVTEGGDSRHETLEKLMDFLFDYYPVDDDTVILTHDAVRPFINEKIIADNIETARKYGGCGTAIPAVDTVFRSSDGVLIDDVPPRDQLYYAQTPQSFNALKFRMALRALTPEQKAQVTDACSVFRLLNEPVALVPGAPENIKITYKSDLDHM